MILLLVAVGCQPVAKTAYAPLNPTPIATDEAMALRQWEPVPAYYENGATVAGNIGFQYMFVDDAPWIAWVAGEPLLFVGQTILLPVTLLSDLNPRAYYSVRIPPTYTAAPPLP